MNAPSASLAKIFLVKAEVALSLSKGKWEESGEEAFKKSISKSIGVAADNVKILAVKEIAARKKLRLLEEGNTKLEVDFEVDVTEKVGGGGDEVVEDLVAKLRVTIKANELVEDVKGATGVTDLSVEVIEEPVSSIKENDDTGTNEEEKVGVHTQPQGGWRHFVFCDANNLEDCLPTYISGGLMIFGICCCCAAYAMKVCSRDERRGRVAKKHDKLMKKRSTKKFKQEFEMPSGFGGVRDSEFSDPSRSSAFEGENPMGRPRPAQPPAGRRKKEEGREVQVSGRSLSTRIVVTNTS